MKANNLKEKSFVWNLYVLLSLLVFHMTVVHNQHLSLLSS